MVVSPVLVGGARDFDIDFKRGADRNSKMQPKISGGPGLFSWTQKNFVLNIFLLHQN